MRQYFETWATQGVYGHFKALDESPLPTWLDADVRASDGIAPIVGALPAEVNVMETLTANLHLLMSAFYQPEMNGRHKIIIESQAFPSDHVGASLLRCSLFFSACFMNGTAREVREAPRKATESIAPSARVS